MIGRCLGVHTDIGRDTHARLFPHIYIYTRSASTLHTLHLIMLGDTLFLPSLPACRPFFFFFLSGLTRCANIARARTYVHTHDPSEANVDVNFYTRFAVQPLISERAKIVVLSYILATEARRGPLIWKYSVTVIKDALG